MQFIQFQSQDPNSLNTPLAGNFNLFVDQADNNLKLKDSAGEVYGGNSGGGYSEVTYSGLVNTITTSGLTAGSFYLITDFRTCYDQPDFDYNNNTITTGATKQAAVEPIMVFATSISTISTEAYQPLYPNDRIQYDWTFSATEVTNSTAFGRITERIDEFNNRTDYDHRTILFKRYRLFTYRGDQPLNGTIELFEDGLVEGNNTSFELLSVGDVIYVPSEGPSYYEITSIDDDTNMTVSGDTISTNGSGLQFYKAIEENNDGDGYFSYKRTNVKTNDFIEYTTFGDAISQAYAKNNYVGNFANSYTDVGEFTFLLANNVFLEEEHSSNKFGNYCYNNTFGADNSNNVWGDWCYQNVSTNDIDDNIIGHYFHDNLINDNLTSNHIGNEFNNNQLLAENEEDFADNIIGNGFNGNTIYSRFYQNEILDNFNDNVIGDSVSLTDFEFYRNYIRNNFNENTIRQDFQNNQIGTNFQENEINGEFKGNTILNGFNGNDIGDGFELNNIGNGFNGNTVYDNFYENTTDYNFNDNVISSDFYRNDIGVYFEDNQPPNSNLFGWNSLSTVSTRTYDTLRESLNGNVGSYIIGKELVMRVISTSQYFKFKFRQWTQNGNGGGFQYERQELDSNGNSIGDSIIFTKTNGGSEVDIIVEGVVELTRDSQGGLYNTITDTPPFNNQWPGPGDTEWNSIYTQENNGRNFTYNKIGNNFESNTIGSYFGYDDDYDGKGNGENGNKIGDYFSDNTILSTMYGNIIGNNFKDNEIRRWFRNNTIKNDFTDNTTNGYENSDDDEYIGFEGNSIGNGFSENEISYGFKDNTIGNNFNSNITGRRFENNNIGNNFNNNKPFNSQLFGWNNLSNLSDRTFRTFKYSLDQSVGQYVVGTEMVMRIISTGQYFRIIFTQWTQGNNGGGFSYNRQEIDSNGNDIGDTVYFTKKDNGDEVDVIVEGVLEITRDNNNVIYNVVVEEDANSDVSPEDTEWNSIFTEVTEAFAFESNSIQNYFQNNSFNNDFNSNTVGNDFSQNDIHGNFYNNTVGNDSSGNNIYIEFYNNSIGNDFDDNTINIDFYSNKIGDDFQNNTTMLIFNNNTIGNDSQENLIGPELSGWNDLSNVADRTYEVWRNSLNGNVGSYILDRQLVMKITSTGQYFKIIFTKWTQGNGGGFQYERQEIDSNGNNIGESVIFTKENYTDDVDVIVEGVVEITRGEVQGIYNVATEGSYNQNTSPADTEWNSIFSQQNESANFTSNIIGNNFNNNECLGVFAYNTIGSMFDNNTIQDGFGFGGGDPRGNRIGNNFRDNNIGEYFYDNTIIDNFYENIISDDFQFNMVNTPVQSTTLTSCALYSGVTVNVFQNGNGDNRLSYYDASDVLTIESLTEFPCDDISFTITSGDFTLGGEIDTDTTPLGDNGVDGFENTDSQNNLADGYYGEGLNGISLSQLSLAYTALGLALDNSTGYIWNVTWGEGSTIESGLVKFGANVDGEFFRIQAIDENDTDWQSPNNDNGTSLVGTFLFPATFTAYLPLINKSGWC
jgi:hypothetical protein